MFLVIPIGKPRLGGELIRLPLPPPFAEEVREPAEMLPLPLLPARAWLPIKPRTEALVPVVVRGGEGWVAEVDVDGAVMEPVIKGSALAVSWTDREEGPVLTAGPVNVESHSSPNPLRPAKSFTPITPEYRWLWL